MSANEQSLRPVGRRFDVSADLLRAVFQDLTVDGDETALVHRTQRISRRDFGTQVQNASLSLERAGVRPGQLVAIDGFNSIDWARGLWSAWEAGAVPVLTNRWWRPADVQRYCCEYGARLLLTDRPDDFTDAPVVVWDASDLGSRDVSRLPQTDATDQLDAALVLATSGTSGAPKPVLWARDAFNAGLRTLMSAGVGDPSTIRSILLTLPLFHIGGVASLVTSLASRRKLVLTDGPFDPGEVLAKIESEQIHMWGGVPTMVQRVLNHPDFRPERLHSLRVLALGGAPVPSTLIERLKSSVPGISAGITVQWGMTETGFLTSVSGEALFTRPGTVGVPLGAVEVRIKGDHGDSGEIWVRSPALMSGYLDGAARAPASWFNTGDVGRIDEDGYVYISARAKDLVIRGGENISCAKVEAILLHHSDVLEAAVVALPDQDFGEVAAAILRVRPGAWTTDDSLARYARGHLSAFEVPTVWSIRTTPLPLSAAGKIDKIALRQELLGRGAEPVDGVARIRSATTTSGT